MTDAHAPAALLHEPAIEAWRRVAGRGQQVAHTERLKKNNRTQVYRLTLPADGRSIIAKRCREQVARPEHYIYEHVLDRRRIRAPELYGFIADDHTDDAFNYCWLFIEDLGPRRHDPSRADERTRLADWLGRLGALTVPLPAQARHPHAPAPRLTPYYRDFLAAAITGLAALPQERTFPSAVQALVDGATRQLERAEAMWPQLEALADSVPHVLAHGDCLPKNIHVTAEPEQAVVPIDWGSAGIGLPGMDLGVSSVSFERACEFTPDVDAYVAAIRPAWPAADAGTVAALAHLGRLIWAIKLVAQSLPGLAAYSAAKSESYLRLYSTLIERSITALARP